MEASEILGLKKVKSKFKRLISLPLTHWHNKFSHSVVSDSLGPHGLQHNKVSHPWPTPRACSNQVGWCHPTTSSSCTQSSPASGSFQMSQFFPSSGQSIGASASASVLPMNIQDWFLYDWLVWSPCALRDPQGSSLTPQFKNINSLVFRFLYSPTLMSLHNYWKNHSFD